MVTDTQREKRRLILRAAITVFARSGYHTSRVSDVATEAGVAYGLVYHYFGSKEDLLRAIFRRTWTRMLEAVEEVERDDAPAREQIAAVARIVLGAWQADPDLVRVLVREVARSPQLGARSTRSRTPSRRWSGSSGGVRRKVSCAPTSTPASRRGSSTARSRRSSRRGCSAARRRPTTRWRRLSAPSCVCSRTASPWGDMSPVTCQ